MSRVLYEIHIKEGSLFKVGGRIAFGCGNMVSKGKVVRVFKKWDGLQVYLTDTRNPPIAEAVSTDGRHSCWYIHVLELVMRKDSGMCWTQILND